MRLEREVQQQLDFYSHPSSLNTTTTHEVLTMVHTSTVKEVIHYSWDNHEVGRVKFHDSIVELTYFGKTHFLPLSHPLTYAEFYTGHPDPNNWKYNTIGCFLVSGKEIWGRKHGEETWGGNIVSYSKEKYEAKKRSDPNHHRRRVYKLRYPDGDFDEYNSATHCELCGRPFEPTGRQRKVQDHSHKTGKTRGVICQFCNTNLAYVDRVSIATLVKYYKEHS